MLKERIYVLEGVDGAGKTSNVDALAKKLDGAPIVRVPPEGFDPDTRRRLARDPRDSEGSFHYLMDALREADREMRTILTHGQKSRIIADNGWVGTTVNVLAMQQVYGSSWSGHREEYMRRTALDLRAGLLSPSAYFFLRVDPEERKRRIAAKGAYASYFDHDERLQTAKESLYRELFEREQKAGIPWFVVDTTRRPVQEVTYRILERITSMESAMLTLPSINFTEINRNL